MKKIVRLHRFSYKKRLLSEVLIAYSLSPTDLFKLGNNREEKWLRHVAIVAILDFKLWQKNEKIGMNDFRVHWNKTFAHSFVPSDRWTMQMAVSF